MVVVEWSVLTVTKRAGCVLRISEASCVISAQGTHHRLEAGLIAGGTHSGDGLHVGIHVVEAHHLAGVGIECRPLHLQFPEWPCCVCACKLQTHSWEPYIQAP